MKITPVPHGLEDLLGRSSLPRSGGLHMSDIYNDLYQDLEPKRFTRGTSLPLLKIEAGLAFETMIEDVLRQRLLGERPGELVSEEGIAYSPDLICFNGVTRLGEIKLTWLSSREVPRTQANGLPPKFEKWMTQCKAYCRCLDTPYARLIAFFVNGTYRPMEPELLAWDIEFSKRELDDNWTMLMNHAKQKNML